MTPKKIAFAVMATAIVLLGYTGLVEIAPRDEERRGVEMRERLVLGYLVHVRIADNSFDEDLADRFAELEDELVALPLAGEAAVVILLDEENRDHAVVLTDRLADAGADVTLLRYAAGEEVSLPPEWEQDVYQDWAGARLRAMIHERTGEDSAENEARIDLVNALAHARRLESIQSVRGFLSLIGLGLLVSMFFSDRQWKRLGKTDFFKLKPLYFDNAVVYRYCAWFFAGAFAISLGLGMFSEMQVWLKDVIGAALYIVWGLFLLKTVVFSQRERIAEAMGLTNLRMHPFNLVQIFGGFSIVVACHFYGEILAGLFWPMDHLATETKYREIMMSPVAAPVYALMACIIAPFFEEVIFRGLILRIMLNNMRPQSALWASALVFAVLHPFQLWPVILFKGFALGVIYYRTANLVVVVWTHALWNTAVLLISISAVGGMG